MLGEKFFLKSKTIIGILIAAVMQLAPFIGISFGEDDAAVVNNVVDIIITFFGLTLGAVGRFTAKQDLKLTPAE